jgi:hypothetical protein
VLSSSGAQLKPLRSQGGFEDEKVEVYLRRRGWKIRERVGETGGGFDFGDWGCWRRLD